jgi:hypothetical protein
VKSAAAIPWGTGRSQAVGDGGELGEAAATVVDRERGSRILDSRGSPGKGSPGSRDRRIRGSPARRNRDSRDSRDNPASPRRATQVPATRDQQTACVA